MALKCLKCKTVYKTNSIKVKCDKCGNTDISNWERVSSKIDPMKHDKEKEYLEPLKKRWVKEG